MSRRHKAEKRSIQPDPRYNSITIARFINRVMLHGKKSVARRIVYDAIEQLAQKSNAEDAVAAFEQALENVKPSLEIKSRRIGGATYQVPIEIPQDRRTAIAMRWIIKHSRQKPGKTMTEGLTTELIDCLNNQGPSIKKRDDTHRMAEANKAFAHYKW